MSDYVKLAEAPRLVFNEPSCGTCDLDVESDGDGWLCPSCGTQWGYNDYEESGTLYEEWSGETLDSDPVPAEADSFYDPQLKAKASELQRGKNLRLWGCEHGFMCSHGCASNRHNQSDGDS